MSAQGQLGSPEAREKRKSGLGKMLSRMKTVLRKDRHERPVATGAPGPSTAQPSSAVPIQPTTSAPPQTAPETPATSKQIKPKPKELPGSVKIPRLQIHEERARKLGERFGVSIQPTARDLAEGYALRIDKPIRMRVRRQCHMCQCQSGFGTTKECPTCKHKWCTECTRYPPFRTEDELAASRVRRAAIIKEQREKAPIVPDYALLDCNPKSGPTVVLKKPSKTGGQELVHKKPRQRVRRHCHECGTLFTGGSRECSHCNHVRCTDCPRDPPKKDKYPYGYPGDVFGPNSTPYYECHCCQTRFPPSPQTGVECSKCSHKKCDDCPRLKPQKVEPEPDPAIVRSITAKLESVRFDK
ncbi:hypothetical protein PpBr36_01267 [Pyricularia pennisetigena]|uniref:hypothetical protein n=1 Tax=Pyricularia pennisetigena TaxID=1578925 RepID=UPI00114FCE91|nr:hypothetical protein PpBr36_01267 [Pyricularia pennisetigena]TLS29817.1 hypothetical protein PpBr36_01267 [Pyricularia pennisetigena]